MQGSEDAIVPVHQSQLFYDRLVRAGCSAKLIVLPDSGHGTGEFRQHNAFYTVGGFFDRVLAPVKISAGLPTTRQIQ
jgi:dipeptidyl aminopeptidase/acylaminoacyl peptidase